MGFEWTIEWTFERSAGRSNEGIRSAGRSSEGIRSAGRSSEGRDTLVTQADLSAPHPRVFLGRRTTLQEGSPPQKKDMCELSLTSSPSKNKNINYIFIYLRVFRCLSSGMICDKISGCSKLAQMEYNTMHDWLGKVIYWEVCKRFKPDPTTKGYMHKSESVLDNKMHKILWYFEIPMDHLNPDRQEHKKCWLTKQKQKQKWIRSQWIFSSLWTTE